MSEPSTNWSWLTDSRVWVVGSAIIGWFTATATFRTSSVARATAIEHEVQEHIKHHQERDERHDRTISDLTKQVRVAVNSIEDVRRDMNKIEIKVDHLADKDRYHEQAQIMAEANMKAMLKFMQDNKIAVMKHDD